MEKKSNMEWLCFETYGERQYVFAELDCSKEIKTVKDQKVFLNIKSWRDNVDFLEKIDITNLKYDDISYLDEILNFIHDSVAKREFNLYETQIKTIEKEITAVKKMFEFLSQGKDVREYTKLELEEFYYFVFEVLSEMKYVEFNASSLRSKLRFRNFQDDMDMIQDKALVYSVLRQKVMKYKTSDADLLILLSNPEYKSKTLNFFIKEHGHNITSYCKGKKEKIDLIDYRLDECALRYASENLLLDKDFVYRYIEKTPYNSKELDYIPEVIKESRGFDRKYQTLQKKRVRV